MPPQATVSVATPQRVLVALAHLSIAYFDRQSAGDWARASVALRVFADVFNEHRNGVLRYFRETLRDPSQAASFVPDSVTAAYSSQTRTAMHSALLAYLGTEARSLLERIPTAPAPDVVRPWYTELRRRLGAGDVQLAVQLAGESVGVAGQNLTQRVEARLYGTEAGIFEDGSTVPFDEAPVIVGPQIDITPTRRSAFVMPTWGWWAIGLGGLAAFGVLAYGVTEQSWFQQRARGRQR